MWRRVEQERVLPRHLDLAEGGDGQHPDDALLAGWAGPGRLIGAFVALRPRDQLAGRGEAGVDPPRRQVLVDPLPRRVPVRITRSSVADRAVRTGSRLPSAALLAVART